MNLCKYKNILGIPNEGIHSYRIGNIAIMDVIFTIILAIIIYYMNDSKFRFEYILAFLFILGIILHRIFCVRTTVDKLLFP
jgi:hypothetical protein